MLSKHSVLMLARNVHDVQSLRRHVHSNRLNGVDNAWLSATEAKRFCPPLDISPAARYPVMGAALQRRAGTARHGLSRRVRALAF
jgi:sarcosine oxidase, subunit beta